MINVFETYMSQCENLLETAGFQHMQATHNAEWPLAKGSIFLMEKDTAYELGGYPKESVNLIVPSPVPSPLMDGGLHIISAESDASDASAICRTLVAKKHVSFGKVILLKVKESAFADDNSDKLYALTQTILLRDSKLRFKDVMLRTSSQNFYTNLKVSNAAANDGFDLEYLAYTAKAQFESIPEVESATVYLIVGESPLYKQLLPVAENVKRVTLALNTIFDGFDMDCGSCAMSAVCDEVDGLRELHRARSTK